MKNYRFWVEIVQEDGSVNGANCFEITVQNHDLYTAQLQAQAQYPRARLFFRGEF